MRKINHSSRFIEMFGNLESKKRLGDVASYINGFAFKPSDWTTTGLPIIRIQNLTGTNEVFNYYDGDYPAQVEVNNGDILISWSATLGVYVWLEGKALLNQHIFKVSFDKGYINRGYFIYAVTQKLDEMSTKTHGTTMRHIVKSDFDNTFIPFPSIDQQDQFALIASQADKSKFSDFKSRFVEQFESLKKTALSEIASDWDKGQAFKKESIFNEGNTPCIHYGELFKYGPIIDTILSWTNESPIKSSAKGDILFPASDVTPNGLARCSALMSEGVLLGGDIIVLRLKNGFIPEFVSYAINMQKDQLIRRVTGSVVRHMSAKNLNSVEIPIPVIAEQKQFIDIIRQADKSKYLN